MVYCLCILVHLNFKVRERVVVMRYWDLFVKVWGIEAVVDGTKRVDYVVDNMDDYQEDVLVYYRGINCGVEVDDLLLLLLDFVYVYLLVIDFVFRLDCEGNLREITNLEVVVIILFKLLLTYIFVRQGGDD